MKGIKISWGWRDIKIAYAGREAELKERKIRIGEKETQTIRIRHKEPVNILTQPINNESKVELGPAELFVMDDVIFDSARTELFLPFMPEYAGLEKQIGKEISEPHNSALFSWLGYGHLTQDQMSKEALYESHDLTRGLPMAFNLWGSGYFTEMLHQQWRRPFTLITEPVTRFKRLYLLIHRHHQIRHIQADFMRLEFGGLPSSSGPKRLYIARTGLRRISNDEELSAFLKDRGFEKMEDRQLEGKSIREQAEIFSSPEIIVSAHGSHLMNTFFCRKDVFLVEMLKFCWLDMSPLSIVRALSKSARYGYMIDWSPWETSEQTLRNADIKADLGKLEAVLDL